MPKLSPDDAISFLSEPKHLVRIATIDSNGMPRVVPLWFIMDRSRLCFTPRSRSVIWQNMLRDPRVGMSVDENDIPYRKVTLQGRFEVLFEPGREREWQHLYRAMASRYLPIEAAHAYVDATDDQPRAWCALNLSARTTRISTWRMPVPGEDPSGIWHGRYYDPGTKLAKPKP